jgi:hypothetical protein
VLDNPDYLATSEKVRVEELMTTNKHQTMPINYALEHIKSLETRLFAASERIGYLEALLEAGQQRLDEAIRERDELCTRVALLEAEVRKGR